MQKPIKRSKQLVHLSRDHHDGLLVVWKVRQGINKQVAPQVLAQFLQHEFAEHLAPHFLDEESLLFANAPADDALTAEAVQQHFSLRQLVNKLLQEPSLENIEGFINLLEQHIRFEERQLFAHYESIFPAEQLKEIEAQLDASHAVKKPCTWNNQFWLREKK
ncbi:hemerythrin domain-containing protein [Aridibaculum aurantiacum]|uniref:hemerythrin domain-containing protein n=1 Tax=Aridibaculum aurantiacum TaxID=2810307 RepID=UPI001A9567BC|nr:hemerythrin domain-containing protein [Aridibaculum aurantiacum]